MTVILRHDAADVGLVDVAVLGDLMLRPAPAFLGGEQHLDGGSLVGGRAAKPVLGVRTGRVELRHLERADRQSTSGVLAPIFSAAW
jgi:hypothetical protein